jgi:acyl-CoA thioester hydrolase
MNVKGEVRLRVRYAETDQMGVVYHANYLVWMEMGRVELCRESGLRYRDLEEKEGILLAVAEASCRFLFPARYDEEVVVLTSIEQASPRLVRFSYEMVAAESGKKLASGLTTHVFCTKELRPCKLPEKYWDYFWITRAR